jgi:putative Mn2+ efflux pump MntP
MTVLEWIVVVAFSVLIGVGSWMINDKIAADAFRKHEEKQKRNENEEKT